MDISNDYASIPVLLLDGWAWLLLWRDRPYLALLPLLTAAALLVVTWP